jgi:hypothetical protein
MGRRLDEGPRAVSARVRFQCACVYRSASPRELPAAEEEPLLRGCREGESNPHAHKGAPRSERGVSAIPPPRHSAASARGSEAAILSPRRESNPHTTMGTSTSSWRVCHSTTGRCRECGAEGSNLSPCGPRFYGPLAGTTRFHTARCREHKLRFNSEGAAATGVGGSGTWYLGETWLLARP